ncbi:glycosyltransferase family 61 protein [Methylobacterium oryzisoli]|uniref:glycosyltransferase family 61 protein n=1 Tax=Methylobacterium oryzisoli TaxID=3385502 RepID=UPI0038923771
MTAEDLRLASCDADRLYGDGGFPDLPAAWSRVLPRAPGVAFVDTLFPGYAYARPAPVSLACADPAFAAEIAATREAVGRNATRGAPSCLFRVEDAVLYDNALHLMRAGGDLGLYETLRPQDLSHLPLAGAPEPRRPPADGALALVFTNAASFNYGHWLIEDLPRLAALRALRRRHPGRRIRLVFTTYHPVIDAVRQRSIRLMLGAERDVEILSIGRDEPWRFDEVHYATPVAVHPVSKSPEALGFLARTLRRRTLLPRLRRAREALAAGRPVLRRKLFVDRSPDYERRLLNREAVAGLLAERGFETVDPLMMSFPRQVAAFAEARVVVGGMGAAMTNTVFCAPGAHVIHLAAEGWDDPFFWDLAAVRGHRYHALYGASPSAERPNRGPYAIDLDALRTALDAAGA